MEGPEIFNMNWIFDDARRLLGYGMNREKLGQFTIKKTSRLFIIISYTVFRKEILSRDFCEGVLPKRYPWITERGFGLC